MIFSLFKSESESGKVNFSLFKSESESSETISRTQSVTILFNSFLFDIFLNENLNLKNKQALKSQKKVGTC